MAQTVEVPLDHWSYRLLDRLRTEGLVEHGLSSTRPLTRNAMAKALVDLKVLYESKLDAAEREAVDFLLFEFSEEVERLTSGNGNGAIHAVPSERQKKWLDWLPGPLYANSRNLFALEKEAVRIFVDPIFYRDATINDTDTLARSDRVYQSTSGFTFWGTLGNRIGFYLNSRDTKEFGTRTYPTSSRIAWPRYGFGRGHGTHVYHDETLAYIHLSLPHFEAQLGKNFNRWGPGYSGALALNNYSTSYDQIKLVAQFWRAKFSYVHGFLRQYPPILRDSYPSNGVERQIHETKYLAAHRLEIAPTSWLNLGVHETVIYGERGLEVAYLNPIMFYRSAEHFLGDRDNATMGADVEARVLPGVRIYGEVFFDDFSVTRIGDNWYGNKVAWLAGCHLTNPLRMPRSDWRLEYVRIDPYVYSHTFPINAYTNYNTVLGHWAGPNSETMLFEWFFWGSREWQVSLSAERYRHGANPADRNVGGDIARPFYVKDSQTVYFLDGIRENRNTFRLEGRYELIRNLRFKLALQATDFDNAPASLDRREVGTFSVFMALGFNSEE